MQRHRSQEAKLRPNTALRPTAEPAQFYEPVAATNLSRSIMFVLCSAAQELIEASTNLEPYRNDVRDA